MTWEITVLGTPVPKPRMTRQDRWKQRPIVLKYWDGAKRAMQAAEAAQLPEERNSEPISVQVKAFFGFPKSYGKRKCATLSGQPHTLRPDVDNLGKAVMDSLFPKEDSHIHRLLVEKQWDDGAGARVEISIQFYYEGLEVPTP